jgi:aminobenzoyl-glutamate utilization protein B
LSIEFFGKASHAGMSPWNGRSAAHATEIFLHGINVMREQMLPEGRLHYLVEKSGEAVNVISDYAKISLTYRGPNAKNVEEYVNWIEEISKGAGLITQTTAKFTKIAGCYDLLPNQTMADKMMQYLEAIKAPEWSSEEQKFAKEIQKTDGCEEIGMDTKITPDPKGISVGGATDVGDISYITPTMGLTVSCWPQGLAPHTWAATVCNGMSIGQKGMILAAEVLALTGLELITNSDFLNTATKEFLERNKGKKYKSLCPSDSPILDGNHASADDLHDAIHHL